jgi:hypothetical protein
MRTFTLILVLFLSWPLYAKDVYKWTSAEGVIHYSDTYQPGAELMHVTGGKSTPSGAEASAGGNPAATAAAGGYEHFEILTPENDETIRSNEGDVQVGLSLSPALAASHNIKILVDGVMLEGQLKGTQFSLKNLNRGSHSLEAKIVDGEGNTVASAPRISFHLRKASIIKP